MSAIPYLITILTAVSLFLFIFFSERAWLPKFGTTEWIHRAANPPKLSPRISGTLGGLDVLAAVVAVILYGGIITALNIFAFPSYSTIIYCICAALTVGTVLLLTKLLFGKTSIAVFAALIFAADTSFLYSITVFGSETMGVFLISIYTLLMLLSAEKPIVAIPSSLFLGIAAYICPKLAAFALLGLCICITEFAVLKKKIHLVLGLVCNTVLPAAVFYGLSALMFGGISMLNEPSTFSTISIDYVYFGISVILFIITVIHLFKDNSYAALFIAVGLLISIVLSLEGVNCLPIFTGAAAAYFSDIIFRRGSKLHKAFCIVFIVIATLPTLIYSAAEIFNIIFP